MFSIGCLLSVLIIGTITTPFIGLIGGGGGWTLSYIILGWREVKQKEVVVIERLGQFLRIIKPGISILCLPGFIDKEKITKSLQSEPVTLYEDEPENKIDFRNGSARVVIKVYRNIDDTRLEQSVWNNVYITPSPDAWLEDALDDIIRPQLQLLTIDEAQVKKDDIARKVPDEDTANRAGETVKFPVRVFEETGYRLERVLITDIAISEADQAERRKSLEGEKEAEKYNQQVSKLVSGFKGAHGNREPTLEELRAIYARADMLVGLSALAGTKANVTLVSRDINGILPTLNVGGNSNNNSTS